MTTETLNESTLPETATLLSWVKAERNKGLVDIKFFISNTEDSTVESFAAEVNEMLRAPVVADNDLF